ncbi:ATP-binding protein [Streptomyces sp. NPDC002889]|uniref:ATP-binding protein n=1 Tax=Streptomyces sp. NPDC002889 TaxID=3364669 RepID=UPI0036BEC6F1
MDNDSFGDGIGPARPPRDAITPDRAPVPALARTVQLVAGDFLLTVNPVDGSEIEPCPPGQQPGRPVRHTAVERAELQRAAQPPVPPGPASPRLPLLERDEERERLVRLLGRGRSVRLTGPAGSGRSTLLDAVAERCGGFAPDGVIRLSGCHRTPAELLQELFALVYAAPRHRPAPEAFAGFVREIGAIVILDDLEFGGASLDELLDAAPECAFLVAASPDVPSPTPDSHLEEVFLSGLGRSAALELLERTVDRPLSEDEQNWAGDLWFESEGLPLRFVQAGALLRQCDSLRADSEAFEEFAPFAAAQGNDVPLPTLGEGAAPASLLASRLGESARQTLRFAVALGGEVPNQAHLPALIGDTHADAAVGELMSCGLLTPVGTRYRLAAGVLAQLTEKGYGEDAVAKAHNAAQHYAWWAGHPSVTPERAVAEADAILAALGTLVPGSEPGHTGAAVLLARSAAPAFATGQHWGAWERTLRAGSEAARIAGEVSEEAYFHHELGVLALCTGSLDRARAELEASIALRGALADKSGTVAGRRALALVADRETGPGTAGRSAQGEAPAAPARSEGPASPPRGIPAARALAALEAGVTPSQPRVRSTDETATIVTRRDTAEDTELPTGPRAILFGARRNLVAVSAGALLAAVLGTVVTLGSLSGDKDVPGDDVGTGQSVNENDTTDGWDSSDPAVDPADDEGKADEVKSAKPSDSATPSPSMPAGDPSAPGDEPSPSSSKPGSKPSSHKPPTSTPRPPSSRPPTPTPTPSQSTPSQTPTTPPASPSPSGASSITSSAPASSDGSASSSPVI